MTTYNAKVLPSSFYVTNHNKSWNDEHNLLGLAKLLELDTNASDDIFVADLGKLRKQYSFIEQLCANGNWIKQLVAKLNNNKALRYKKIINARHQQL